MKRLEIARRGLTLAYDEMGSGLPVVLLHAFPFDREMWAPQLGPLAAAGYRVLAPDFPAFGQSTAGTEPFTIEGAADTIAEFLDALKIDRAVIGGLSMGGYVAMAFARRHPARLLGLILADTKAAPDDETARENRDKAIAAVRTSGPIAFGESMLLKLLSEHTRATNPEAVALVRTITMRQSATAVIAALVALRDRPDAAPGLEAVAVPTLVVVGEHDAVTPPLMAVRIAGQVKGSELHHIPDAGHLANLEHSAAFNAVVVAFLNKMK